jgi:hypothetical protein
MGPLYQKTGVTTTSSFSERYQKRKRERMLTFSIIIKLGLLIFTSLSIYIFIVTYYWYCNHQVEQQLTAMKFHMDHDRYVIIPSPIDGMDIAMTQDASSGET